MLFSVARCFGFVPIALLSCLTFRFDIGDVSVNQLVSRSAGSITKRLARPP